MLTSIETKLINFTKNDLCIIFIGEEDFLKTKDYLDIIYHLRSTLLSIKNTNIIICAPIYKYEENMNLFNWRIEHFNNLLYLDAITHKYAEVLDSNLNLKYDHTMFYKKSGKLNNYGLSVIFNDLNKMIIKMDNENVTFSPKTTNTIEKSNNADEESIFFRD